MSPYTIVPLFTRFAQHALRASLWLVLLAVVTFTKTDPDLWGHVRFGMDIIRDAHIVQADTYSFTSDREWVNHEWAAEVLSGAAFLVAGNAGLVALKLLIVCGVLAMLNATLRSEGVGDPRHRDLLLFGAVVTTIQQTLYVRPQLFSLLFFSALMLCLTRGLRDRRYLLALPPIFCAWANSHGGWIVGGGALIVWISGLVSSRAYGPGVAARYTAAGVFSLAAAIINPHGLGLVAFLRDTVGFGRADIVDWQPIYALGPAIWALWIVTAMLAAAGLVGLFRAGVRIERVLVVVALGIGSFQVNRLLAFFALATFFLLGPSLAATLSRPGRIGGRVHGRAKALMAATVAFLLSAGALRAAAANTACVQVDAPATPEPGAVAFLKEHAARGRLLVWFDWGQYALWHLSPDLKVSVDGRRETVYSDRVQDRHLRFFFDAAGGNDLPSELDADYLWLPRWLPAVRSLRTGGWTAIYEGERSVIFARAPVPQRLPPAPQFATARRCFPSR
ncbi:MAG: hypothetical protein ACRD1U_10545 [Vicinamibacterales bacterium]